MLVIPAVDILNGRCARLAQGDYARATFYNDDPADAAAQLLDAGARRLHIVDLDGAKQGAFANFAALEKTAAAAKARGAKVEAGGGVRRLDDIPRLLDAGADFVLLGTAFIKEEEFRAAALADYASKIIACLDAKNGHLATTGWTEVEEATAANFARALTDSPPAAIMHTDIARDGMLTGLNLDAIREVAQAAPCPVIAGGGAAGLSDIRALKTLESSGVFGAVVGRAIYTGDLDLRAAIAAAQ